MPQTLLAVRGCHDVTLRRQAAFSIRVTTLASTHSLITLACCAAVDGIVARLPLLGLAPTGQVRQLTRTKL